MDFSFIVPVHNNRDTLSACVHSILQARIPAIEILLIDDGSTDGSGQLSDILSGMHPQITVIHQSNQGVAAARNTGLTACTGTHILFMDADDMLDSAALKMLLSSELCMHADLTIFGMEFRYFHRGRQIKREYYSYGSGRILSADTWGKELAELFRTNALSSVCNKIFRRDIVEHHQLRMNSELHLYEDLDFCLRYLSLCNELYAISEPVYRYYLPADSGKIHHRLARVDCIPAYLRPIEGSLHQLMESIPAVTSHSCATILEHLHLMLARQKIAVADIAGIQKICRDYIQWEDRTLPAPTPSEFRDRICSMRVYSLWIRLKAETVRHRLGIRYRWLLSFTERIN